MDKARHHAYLRAMGISTWTARCPPVCADPETPLAVPNQASTPRRDPAPAVAAADDTPGGPAPTAQSPLSAEAPLSMDLIEPALTDPARMDWDALRSAVSGCRACGLCESRTQTVFGVGDRVADLLVIGEAPGAEEDRQGEPFVGRAGQLLNRMLLAINLPREQVYIANILKCRPPGNRDPKPDEARRCAPFLMRQIALIRPRVILAAGRISAQMLLQTDLPVGRLRRRWFEFGPDSTPLRVTYHPAYLLRTPAEKAKAWEDLTSVVQRLRGAVSPLDIKKMDDA